ncbi:hypothetical protein SPBR_09043 [Sporothrix brasiliensis 5110]|uniref:Amidoligase enzyme n=1 Tax=Sporothrix brasiliensis 5110 TaxID=1398154 RepID=A0A0C2J1K3_9PEZI|nr:uncharacterized protein SPBR_09043 [Sporothrix brasiliensis 5110]KIH90977.1 hypothetical protein SPBR_09043 [Sporothrix brasiliensis 5110]
MASTNPRVREVYQFTFGVELELYLRPKNTAEIDTAKEVVGWGGDSQRKGHYRDKIQDLVHEILTTHTFKCVLGMSKDYEDWSVTEDGSLVRGEPDGYFGVELVSDVMSTDTPWAPVIFKIYSILGSHFDIATSQLSGTHVHVRPHNVNGDVWKVDEVRAILKALCVLDQPFTAMLPPSRRDTFYTRSLLSDQNGKVNKLCLFADDVRNGRPEQLFGFLDQLETTTEAGKLFEDRFYYVNLKALPGGTIEFRFPPPAETAEKACHWILWVLSFARGCIMKAERGFGPNIRGKKNLHHLMEIVITGHRLLPASAKTSVKVLEPALYGHNDPPVLSLTDREKRELAKIKREKDALFASGGGIRQ